MSTTRRRRMRAYHEQLQAQEGHRSRGANARVEQIRRFDDAVVKVSAWLAIALFVLIAAVAVVA
jgi:hypothetical protein